MGGIGCAGHEPPGFEAVQDEGDVAAVDPEPPTEARLAERAELGQADEHGVIGPSRGGDGLDDEPVGVAREVGDQPAPSRCPGGAVRLASLTRPVPARRPVPEA